MKKDDFRYIGEDIKRAIHDNLQKGDYNKMGKDIGESVNYAADIAFEELKSAIDSIRNETIYTKQAFQEKKADTKKDFQKDKSRENRKEREATNRFQFRFPHNPVGRVKKVLYTVFGSIGMVGTGIIFASMLAMSLPIPITAIAGVGFLGFLAMNINGTMIRKRLRRYERYLELFKGKERVTFDEIADFTGKSKKYVYKDIRKMIYLGMFPQGRVLQNQSYFFLNDESFYAYKKEREEAKLKEAEFSKKGYSKEEVEGVTKVIEVGYRFINAVEEANQNIKDIQVSNKIKSIEMIIKEILKYIESHPNQVDEVRRLIEYYLPTTLKLLHAYESFEKQKIQSENIQKGKVEIQEAVDTINEAFTTLYNSLFEDVSMDIEADISVMKTMMEEEGLTHRK